MVRKLWKVESRNQIFKLSHCLSAAPFDMHICVRCRFTLSPFPYMCTRLHTWHSSHVYILLYTIAIVQFNTKQIAASIVVMPTDSMNIFRMLRFIATQFSSHFSADCTYSSSQSLVKTFHFTSNIFRLIQSTTQSALSLSINLVGM